MDMQAEKDAAKGRERRVNVRVPLVQVVQLQHPAGPQLASARDLSMSGIGVLVDEPPSRGTLVNVALDLGPEGRLDVLSVVVRVGPTVGLRFTDLTPSESLTLQHFLARRRAWLS